MVNLRRNDCEIYLQKRIELVTIGYEMGVILEMINIILEMINISLETINISQFSITDLILIIKIGYV